ncbi:MAG: hypothetical protein KGL44_03710 [Sphingomonadales bacterium]|nr:hypothetical protein [Sphingomonadales bacterium]
MTRAATRRAKRPRTSCHELDAAAARDSLHELMPVGAGDQPDTLLGWRDSRGFLTRVRADYPNGWRLVVHFSKPKNGKVTITSCKASMSIKVKGT